MIKSLEINNFQSHKNTKLDFHHGVNAIIGPSDSGKTAILRALNWLTFNRPLGESFRSNWGGGTQVRLVVANGMGQAAVTRVKTDRENYYHQSVDNQRYEAIKTNFPERIKQLLKIEELNIQSQLDSPFLLHSISSGEIAKYLNEAVNLEVIDSSLANANSKIRQLGRDKISTEKCLADIEKQLDELDWLKEAEKELIKLEEIEIEFINNKKHIRELTELVSSHKTAEQSLQKFSRIDELEKQLLELQQIEIDVGSKRRLLFDLQNLITNIETEKRKITDINYWIEEKEKELKTIMPKICPLCRSKIR